ncbi:hypothetical protein [Kaarinaea lacus]
MRNNKKSYVSAIIFAGAMLGSAYASADCSNLPLANGLAAGFGKIIDGTETSFKPNPNTTVCVDIPNGLTKNFFVFNIDTPATKDGTVDGTPSALNHMWLMGSANLAIINKQKSLGNDVSGSYSIKGIIHGSALTWALNDDWWKAQVDEYGNQLYPDGNPNKAWFDKLNWLKAHGMDIQLEVCAVSLSGAGYTHDDVYPGILVNQGAFGRMSSLHQNGYAVVAEGWVDNDKKRHHDDD